MPANIQFGQLTPAGALDPAKTVQLNGAAYLIHACADPVGTHPKMLDLWVYVLAYQKNNMDSPQADPSLLIKAGTLKIFATGDANPTHEFKNIHLKSTIAARRDQNGLMVLLKFGYNYDRSKVPGWNAGENVNIAMHYPKDHDTRANYKVPILTQGGAVHQLMITGDELKRTKGQDWVISPEARHLLAFEYATTSGLTADASTPQPERIALVSYRDNRCRILNTLLEQDRQIRINKNSNPKASLSLALPNMAITTAISIPLHHVADSRLVLIEHRNFWPKAIGGGKPWNEPLIPAQPDLNLEGSPELGTIGEAMQLGLDALNEQGKPTAFPDVILETVILKITPDLARTLGALRA